MEKLAVTIAASQVGLASGQPRTSSEPTFQPSANPAAINGSLTLLIPCNRQFLTRSRMVTENSKTPAQWPTVLMRIGLCQLSQTDMLAFVLSHNTSEYGNNSGHAMYHRLPWS